MERGYTLEEAAEIIGISSDELQKYENSKIATMTLKKVIEILDCYGIELDFKSKINDKFVFDFKKVNFDL